MTTLRIPGAVDPHVHLRDMDWAHKATVERETAAALAGGYWAVLDMPNTPPNTTTAERLRAKYDFVAARARCDFGLYMGADAAADGSEYPRGAPDAVGLKMYCDHTTGSLLLADQESRRRHLRAWAAATDKPVAVHAEGDTLRAVLQLVREERVRVHCCHVSLASEILLLREAKADGLPVSVGVTPHHLYLDAADRERLGGFAMVKPPLKTNADREALWAAVLDGTVDTIESDHAPHTREEKSSVDPPFGLPGLETTVPLMVTAMRDRGLTEQRLIELIASNAQRLFGLAPPPRTFTLVDTESSYVISDDQLRCSSGWSPFSGMRVRGRVTEVRVRGRVVFDGEDVIAQPGEGRRLIPVMLELYELAWRPAAALIARTDPMTAHARTVSMMRTFDGTGPLLGVVRRLSAATFPKRPTRVGGVDLPYPLILAAGLVKGDGFSREEEALAAVRAGQDIIPGWRSAPALVGPVEFGSYTRHPRLGNSGRVLWRDSAAGWMQNRVGLRNPGARAASAHLARHAAELPPVWGLNLAVSPGVTDAMQSRDEIVEAVGFFREAFAGLEAGPSWLTLNLSCPNTEDDPRGVGSAELARVLCGALVEMVKVPVWAKIGPDLSDDQLAGLVAAFAETGVCAVVATNTQARPVPGGYGVAGVSGSRLRPSALDVVARLNRTIDVSGLPLDIIAGGGILEGTDLRAFRAAGARAAMLYTAMVLRGPLAAALILREAEEGEPDA